MSIDPLNRKPRIAPNGTYDNGRRLVSIGSYVRTADGHAGYVRLIDYAIRTSWISDGDGARKVLFEDIIAPER